MGRKANPALIGAFVVGAVALAVIGVLVFGSGRLFKNTVKFVCFFPGAVDGLAVGAPVKFKGVEIGSVTDIRVRLEGQGEADATQIMKGVRIPVIFEIDPEKLSSRGGKIDLREPERLKTMIELGLRAQLNAQSLVTGLLFVQLDYLPNVPPVYVLPPDTHWSEIPAAPTKFEQVQSAAVEVLRKIEEMHLENLVRSANEAIDGFKNLVNAPTLRKAVDGLPDTVANLNEAIKGIRELTVRLDHNQGPLFESLRATSEKTGVALDQGRETLQSVQTLVEPNSALAVQLGTALQEVSSAARAVRLLADYLERNPSSLVRGKDVNQP